MSTTADTVNYSHPTEGELALLAAVLDWGDEVLLAELAAVTHSLGACGGVWFALQHLNNAEGLARMWHHTETGAELVSELVWHLSEREWAEFELEELRGYVAHRRELALEAALDRRQECDEALELMGLLVTTEALEATAGLSWCTACSEWGGRVLTTGPEVELCPECLTLHKAAEVELCPECLALMEAGEGFLCPECLADVEAGEVGE
jgi:hypothetical protein